MDDSHPSPAAAGLTCDFCGASSQEVRRVALDRGYDRLLKAHKEQYACPDCSVEKEQARQGR